MNAHIRRGLGALILAAVLIIVGAIMLSGGGRGDNNTVGLIGDVLAALGVAGIFFAISSVGLGIRFSSRTLAGLVIGPIGFVVGIIAARVAGSPWDIPNLTYGVASLGLLLSFLLMIVSAIWLAVRLLRGKPKVPSERL